LFFSNPLSDSSYVLQVNFPPAQSKVFQLISPQFQVSGNVACFSFLYYFMLDTVDVQKNVLAINLFDVNKNTQVQIWAASGMSKDLWNKGEAQIDSSGTFQVN